MKILADYEKKNNKSNCKPGFKNVCPISTAESKRKDFENEANCKVRCEKQITVDEYIS